MGWGIGILCLDEFSKDWAAPTVPGGNEATWDFKPMYKTWWLRCSGDYPKQFTWVHKDTSGPQHKVFSPPVVENTLNSEKPDLAQRLEVGRAQDIIYGCLSDKGNFHLWRKLSVTTKAIFFTILWEKKVELFTFQAVFCFDLVFSQQRNINIHTSKPFLHTWENEVNTTKYGWHISSIFHFLFLCRRAHDLCCECTNIFLSLIW